jgi:hypothetical protein
VFATRQNNHRWRLRGLPCRNHNQSIMTPGVSNASSRARRWRGIRRMSRRRVPLSGCRSVAGRDTAGRRGVRDGIRPVLRRLRRSSRVVGPPAPASRIAGPPDRGATSPGQWAAPVRDATRRSVRELAGTASARPLWRCRRLARTRWGSQSREATPSHRPPGRRPAGKLGDTSRGNKLGPLRRVTSRSPTLRPARSQHVIFAMHNGHERQ